MFRSQYRQQSANVAPTACLLPGVLARESVVGMKKLLAVALVAMSMAACVKSAPAVDAEELSCKASGHACSDKEDCCSRMCLKSGKCG